jgi:hypothetical protein
MEHTAAGIQLHAFAMSWGGNMHEWEKEEFQGVHKHA